jgi:hypothetical protein
MMPKVADCSTPDESHFIRAFAFPVKFIFAALTPNRIALNFPA